MEHCVFLFYVDVGSIFFFFLSQEKEQTLQGIKTGPKLSLIKDTHASVLFP